ncbi:MAG: PAS domain S-box protein [Pseudomonadota bacterium]
MQEQREQQQQLEKQIDGLNERIAALEKMLSDAGRREQKLGESEARLRLLVERSPNGIVVINPGGRFVYANEAAVKNLGYERQEFFDLAIPDVEVGESVDRFGKRYEDAMAGRGLRYETTHRKKDGSLMDVEVLMIVIDRGEEKIVYSIWRDMTERKLAEKRRVHHTRELAFLSKTAMEFVEFSPDQDIFEFIGKKLEELAGEDANVGVAEYHEASNSLTPRFVTSRDGLSDKVVDVMGMNPLHAKFAGVDEESKKDLARGVLVKVDGGFYGLLFERAPREVCEKLDELFGLGEIHTMGLRRGGKLLGNVIVITREGKTLDNKGLIETFVNQASVAVERNIADRERVKAVAAVVDAMSDGLLLYEMKGTVIHINTALEKMTGYAKSEVAGEEIMELAPRFIHPADLEETAEVMTKFLGGEVPSVPLTLTLIAKDGSGIPVAASGSYVRDAEGKPTHAVILIKDITALKEAEDEIRKSRERLQLLFDYAPDAYFLYNARGEFIDGNKAAEEMSGYKKEELIGESFLELDLLARDDLDKAAATLRKIAAGEAPDPQGYTLKRKGGSRIMVEISSFPVQIDRQTQILGIARDVTKQRNTEMDLRESEETLRALYNGIPIPTFTYQRSGKKFLLIDYNDAAGDLTMGKIEEYVGMTADEMFDDLPAVREDLELCFTGKSSVRRERQVQTKRLREKKHYSVNYAYVDPDLILVHAEDITERKRAEEELRTSREQLRDLSAHTISVRETERTNIAREIHDELGQNLTALKMDLSWLAKKLPRTPKALIGKTRDMARLVNATIRTVRRVSTELRPGLLDDLGLAAAIEWQAGEFQKRTGIKCDLVVRPEEIVIDRDRSTAIFRIFQEALTNVARHAGAKKVTASLRKRAGNLVLKVEDNGKGITRKQVSDSKSFGLIGMRERAHFWGGKVTVRGAKGRGTTVAVSIPIEGRGGKRVGEASASRSPNGG